MAPYEGRSMMEDQMEDESGDREISLSPGIVLGVFLALALVCAVFFGFGYSVGRRSAPAASAAEVQSGPVLGGGSKPSPGSSLGTGVGRASKSAAASSDDGTTDSSDADARSTIAPERNPVQKPSSALSNSGSVTTSIAPAPVVRPTTIFHPPAVVAPPPPVVAGVPGSAGAGSIVQVAAFSHQQDAELVAGALRKRGYDVVIRQQSQDSLLHVQLGPFASKKEADAMRQRLQADGYNAIVK